jgi:hypothetical protein
MVKLIRFILLTILLTGCGKKQENRIIIDSLEKDIDFLEYQIDKKINEINKKARINENVFYDSRVLMEKLSKDITIINTEFENILKKNRLDKKDIELINNQFNKLRNNHIFVGSNEIMDSLVNYYLDTNKISSLNNLTNFKLTVSLLDLKKKYLRYYLSVADFLSDYPESDYFKFNYLDAIILDRVKWNKESVKKEIIVTARDTMMPYFYFIGRYDSLIKIDKYDYRLNGSIDTLWVRGGRGLVFNKLLDKYKNGFAGYVKIRQTDGRVLDIPFRYKN